MQRQYYLFIYSFNAKPLCVYVYVQAFNNKMILIITQAKSDTERDLKTEDTNHVNDDNDNDIKRKTTKIMMLRI